MRSGYAGPLFERGAIAAAIEWEVGYRFIPRVYEMRMRARVLTLVILTVAWMTPVGGSSCPSTAMSTAAHSHVQSEDPAAESHHHAAPRHADAAEAGYAHKHPAPDGNDSSCCQQRGSGSLVVQPALQDAKPRPKFSVAVPTLIAVSPAVPVWLSTAELRYQPPRPAPYASTRRPLLI
jgi:hypothetical protein